MKGQNSMDFVGVNNLLLNCGDPIVETGLQFTVSSDKVFFVIGPQPTRLSLSGNEAAECIQKTVMLEQDSRWQARVTSQLKMMP